MKSTLALLASLLLIISGIALGDTSMDRILSALETGEITNTVAADLLIRSVTDYDNLPSIYTEGTDHVPCGTPAFLEASRLTADIDSPLASRPILSGPVQTFNSDDGHFKIHWTNSGVDATSYSYAYTVAVAADSSWQVECNEMNFIYPPPDNGVGGDDLYDIYICHLEGGTLGYTSRNGEYHPPDSSQACSASHVVIGNSITNVGCRNCTVAHEFQHAIQFSYSYEEQTWFMENCAVWMEEMVYPDVDDYRQYITSGDNALRTPWMDIRSNAMYWYGAFTWPWMMWDRWNYEAVREVWENCAAISGSSLIEAHEQMFASHGTDFESFFMDYGCWRWFTAGNWFSGCGMYKEEASTWTPGPRVLPWHNITTLPASGDQTTNYEPDRYGIHWIKVDLTNYQNDWIEMAFNGRDSFEWNLGVIMQDNAGRLVFDWYECDPTTGDFSVSVGADGWDYAIFFPAFMSNSPLDHLYTFNITATTGIEGSPSTTDLLNLNVSSNPIQAGGYVTFDLPFDGNAKMCVYDMSGRIASTLIDEEMQAGSHSVQFEGSDMSNGTYFIMLFANDKISAQKVVLSN
ncbi:MAG: T9SS type A sorting domain-containing protein [Candidatus Aegiribacteria sp.]|nr:T9SS type A sorting domain-containing protein [Candidatus Aegiribacteria sp.]